MSELVRSIELILSEIERIKAHSNVYAKLRSAVSHKNSGLYRFYDFFELTIEAHFAATILCATRLLDRDKRTRSIHWLLNYIEENPEEFHTQQLRTSSLKEKLEQATDLREKLRRIRNKWVAHRERMTKSETDSFLNEHGLGKDELDKIVQILSYIVTSITDAHKDYDWSWTMIAFDEETDDLIKVLSQRSASRAY